MHQPLAAGEVEIGRLLVCFNLAAYRSVALLEMLKTSQSAHRVQEKYESFKTGQSAHRVACRKVERGVSRPKSVH